MNYTKNITKIMDALRDDQSTAPRYASIREGDMYEGHPRGIGIWATFKLCVLVALIAVSGVSAINSVSDRGKIINE